MLIPERTCSYSSRALKETRERSVHRPRPCCCCNFFPFGSKPRRVLPAPSSGLGFPSPPSLAVFLLRSNNTIQPFRSLWINFHSAYLALFSSLSRALRPSLHPRHLFPFPSPSSSCSSLLILHFSRCSPFPFPLTPSLIPLSFSRLSRSSFIPFIISPCPPFLAFPHNAHASTPEPTERLSPRHHDSISPSFLSVSLPLIIRLPPPIRIGRALSGPVLSRVARLRRLKLASAPGDGGKGGESCQFTAMSGADSWAMDAGILEASLMPK